jgi:DNA-binding transcriptional LysR family regulator
MSDINEMKVRQLDGGLLLVFRELLRRRRATEAAQALGLSPSAISHALTRLRVLFDDPLFVRRPHGLEPTRRALALGPRLEALVGLADAAMKADAAFNPATSERRFHIAAPDFFIALVGAGLVTLMRKEAPKASFYMQSMTADAAFGALKQGDIDFAIGRFGAVRPGFEIAPLYEDRYCVVARRTHPRFKRRISVSEYASCGHVFSYAPGEGGESEDMTESKGTAANAIVPRWLTVLAMIATCDAIATVPRRLAERYADVFGLRILKADFVNTAVSLSVIRRSGAGDEGVDWFLKQVRRSVD